MTYAQDARIHRLEKSANFMKCVCKNGRMTMKKCSRCGTTHNKIVHDTDTWTFCEVCSRKDPLVAQLIEEDKNDK